MGKLKTKKGVAKRFKLTKKGKIKYYPGGKSHLASSKEPERTRHLRKGVSLEGKREQRFLRQSLPYG